MSPCVLGLVSGRFIGSAGHRSKYIFWNIFGLFLPEHTGVTQGWFDGGKNPPALYHPCNLSGCFGIGPCWSLGCFQAIIDISSEHNCRKNNNIKLFSTVLSWFDLVVTLSWPWHDLGVTPPWSLTQTHVTMCTWVGFRTIYCKCWPLVHIYIFLIFSDHFC